MTSSANFDPVARAYRWLEYLSFGPLLEWRRFAFLSDLADRRRALVLGDGDGRFLARLLRVNPELCVDAVDSSEAMLRLLEARVRAVGASPRVHLHRMDARDPRLRVAVGFGGRKCDERSPKGPYDLVVTHFFLDCLRDDELTALLDRVVPCLAPGAVWVVSEFAIPEGAASRPARRLVQGLYWAFGMTTGLATRSLPDYPALLTGWGFTVERRQTGLAGILVSELWRRNG